LKAHATNVGYHSGCASFDCNHTTVWTDFEANRSSGERSLVITPGHHRGKAGSSIPQPHADQLRQRAGATVIRIATLSNANAGNVLGRRIGPQINGVHFDKLPGCAAK
jgi:hypothetical protein